MIAMQEKESPQLFKQWGLSQNNKLYNSNDNAPCEKIKLGCFYELQKFPKASITFIAFCFSCVNFVRSHGGLCFWCNRNPEIYDLSFCYEKEIWLLCIQEQDFVRGNELAYLLLNHEADKVLIIPFNKNLLGRNSYDA